MTPGRARLLASGLAEEVVKRDDYLTRIRRHYEEQWQAEPTVVPLASSPVALPDGFSVLCFDKPRGNPVAVYATCGMSAVDDPRRIELHLSARAAQHEVAAALASIAARHREGATADVHKIVDVGGPWWEGSRCSHGLVAPPYMWGPTIEWLHLREGSVRCLWVIPITPDEAEIGRRSGGDVLEAQLQDGSLDHLDPGRIGFA
jgi:hypothetical protein